MSDSSVSIYTLKKPSSSLTLTEDERSSTASGGGGGWARDPRTNLQLVPHHPGSNRSLRSGSVINDNLSVRNDSRSLNTINFVMSESLTFVPGPSWGMLDGMPVTEQEKLLTEELLLILQGSQSSLIQVHEGGRGGINCTVDPRVENSLKELALQVAQLAIYYHSVTKFVESWCKFEHGQVNQALSAELRDVLKDYFVMLSQIESLLLKGELSLQKMVFYINPTLKKMKILGSLVSEIERRNARGGAVLTILHEKAVAMVGNSIGQPLCFDLAQKAATPYFVLLESWIYKGVIKDPFNEFFVLDTDREEGLKLEVNDNDNYWDTRYKLVQEKCPSFLKNMSGEVLKAGKYLNVIRQCGKDVCVPPNSKITYSIHERVYTSLIEKAYIFASKTLLDLLLNEYDLMQRLRSVKHYLLMDQGDFIVQFLDLTETELSKQIDDLNPVRLKSLLELALRTSSSSTDPYKDCVAVQLFPYGIAEQMIQIIAIETPLEQQQFVLPDNFNYGLPGFEGFSFSYNVQWPISLVLNARAITCYQMIFRHLFFCKHVERQLCKVWIAKKSFKNSELKEDEERAAAFFLHQQMLNFVQNLQYYMAFEVIEPAWHTFLTTMTKVTNVDEVLDCHMSMVNSILGDSMLINPSLLAKITALLSLCLQFSKKVLAGSSSSPDSSKTQDEDEMLFEIPVPTTAELQSSFKSELVAFLREVSTIVQSENQNSKVANIIYRVNFNGFYTEALEI